MPKRKFRPATPKVTMTNPPIPQAPPNYEVPPAVVRADTPWPGTGKVLGNLFKERNWLLLKGYLATQNKKNDIDTPSLKEELKTEKPEIADSPKEDKCDGHPIVPSVKHRKRKKKTHNTGPYQTHEPRNQPRPNHNYYGKQKWKHLMTSIIWTASQTQSWTPSQMNVRNTITNTGMRH